MNPEFSQNPENKPESNADFLRRMRKTLEKIAEEGE